ncbi:MAG: hypothetical protein KatS3mg060_3073 [Dehalococcoidia bacterium]|nr:MAG: hypothetical protein KatS3mg060_3073 [Dehalococcoidia bacterium]
MRIRLGLRDIRGIGAAADTIVAARAAGPFRSLADAIRRLPLSREAFENLILAGAFDGFGLGRRELLWQLGLFIRGRGAQPALELANERDCPPLAPLSEWGSGDRGTEYARSLPQRPPDESDSADVCHAAW